ncbi:MAG TPA: succinylglutamate desuccinylase [Noviherbaspirillum sp.]|uniref:succinylglutamate desuccinylase n=1 Tax=Noviherbaspirillum sp. TaxID=1926288 RepID=UPI002D53EA1D|nr:succinylglutamate desuccinylase [Noviherbaspirillum sp.]HYD96833.1 succinylglutamate desuccinylase [Noviherbaspirillum sp.]
METRVSEQVRALAEGDFTHIADRFANAGFRVRLPARGILQLSSSGHMLRRPALLLSVGVHGDETAPIEMLAGLLDALAAQPHALAVDLMVVVGNIAAIAQGRRFIDADLNRMFREARGDLQSAAEAARADTIMRATAGFFAAPDADKWHLDLHTAIRASRYPAFAVVPEAVAGPRRDALLGFLGRAGIEAAILSPASAGTYSAHTAQMFGATSATVELGQVGMLGANDLDRFDAARHAIDAFLRTVRVPAGTAPAVFRVAQELVKRSDAFRMAFGRDTENFTAMAPGSLIAEDGDLAYRVGAQTEYVVFPNPDVRPGLRAGLMVVREDG